MYIYLPTVGKNHLGRYWWYSSLFVCGCKVEIKIGVKVKMYALVSCWPRLGRYLASISDFFHPEPMIHITHPPLNQSINYHL